MNIGRRPLYTQHLYQTEIAVDIHSTIRFIKGFPWDGERYFHWAGKSNPRNYDIERGGRNIEIPWMGYVLLRGCEVP